MKGEHTLVCIGFTSEFDCYLDMTVEEAIEAYLSEEEPYFKREDLIDEKGNLTEYVEVHHFNKKFSSYEIKYTDIDPYKF